MVCSRFYQLFWKFEKYKLNLLQSAHTITVECYTHFKFSNTNILDCLYMQLLHDSPEFYIWLVIRQRMTKCVFVFYVYLCFFKLEKKARKGIV